MNKSSPGTTPPVVFIASHDAEEFRDLLLAELGSETECRLATSKKASVSAYNNESVVLGRPDFVADLLKACPPVKWVQSTWAGVNLLVDVDFKDYQLTGIRDIFGPQMAEYALGYLLAHEIRLARRLERQRQHEWDATPSGTLRGKVLGIMGTGSIGCFIASAAEHFDLQLIGYNTSGNSVPPFNKVYASGALSEFLAICDYIIALLPDLPSTNNLLNATAFAFMKKSAYLINVGRSNVIDNQALCIALEKKLIAGAVLDVFDEEPLPSNSPLWDTPNLVVTSHIAADSKPAHIAKVFAMNYRRYIANEALLYKVDFKKGY